MVDNTCFEYTAGDQLCNLCTDSNLHMNKITGWHKINSTGSMKDWIVNRGPLVTCIAVYTDFYAYKSGIYRTTFDPFDSNRSVEFEGGHCGCCVGYNDSKQCWICKNSWGTSWGEKGYFRIAFDDCGIDESMQKVEGVYSITSLSQLLTANGFKRTFDIETTAHELGLTRPFLISQLIEKLV